jgi:hypothetical protein
MTTTTSQDDYQSPYLFAALPPLVGHADTIAAFELANPIVLEQGLPRQLFTPHLFKPPDNFSRDPTELRI